MRQVETNVLHAYDDPASRISRGQSVPGMDRLCIDHHTCGIHLHAAPAACLDAAHLPAAGQPSEHIQRDGGNADVPHPGQFLTAVSAQHFRRIAVDAHESRQQPFIPLPPGELPDGECGGHRLTYKGRHLLIAGTLCADPGCHGKEQEKIQDSSHLHLYISFF